MTTSVRVLSTDCTQPHANLAMEELLCQALPAGQAVLFLWQNAHTVVIGAGQNAWRECHTKLFAAEGGTLARRASGGGAVYHDMGNLNFSIIVPPEDYDLTRQCSVIVNAVAALGLDAVQSGRNDITVDGRKFSGNAFRIQENSALHHGTLLVCSDLEQVGRYLNTNPSKLSAKGVKSVPARVVSLNQLCEVDIERMRREMIRAFCAEYGAAEPEWIDVKAVPGLAERTARYRDWNWVYGASPVGDVQVDNRFPWGGVEIYATLKHGLVQAAQVYTDSMDEHFAGKLSGALTGCPWQGEALAARTGALGHVDLSEWLGGIA